MLKKLYFWIAVLMMLCPLTAQAFAIAPLPLLPVDTTAYRPYTYVRFLNEGDSIKLNDEEFFDLAGRIIFPINKAVLPKNDSIVLQLKNEVLPLINRDSLELASIIIRGATSPEGPYRFNKQLGALRAEALVAFLRKHLERPIDPETFSQSIDVEDYRTLLIMMRRRSDKDYAVVKTMCDRYLPSGKIQQLKKELHASRQGILWRRLLRDYFPQLRASRLVLFFRAPRTYAGKVLTEEEQKQVMLQELILPPVDSATVILPEPEPLPVITPVVPIDTVKPAVVVEPPVIVEPADTLRPTLRVPRRELLSVKSNLLFDFAYVPGYDRWCPIPNVALEYYPKRGHFTFGASMDFPWWQHHNEHKFFEIRNYQVEARYYFRSGGIAKNPPGEGIAFRGVFLQAYAHAGLYSICFDADRGWEGEGWGGGLGLGYVMQLGKSKDSRWRLEFAAQFGYFKTKYDPYVYQHPVYNDYKDNRYYYNWIYDPDNFVRRNHRFTWLGPTRIGVTLSYDLLFRRNDKKGVSFRSYERKEVEP